MRNRFDEQLARLDTELITMGALCEEAIRGAAGYLLCGKKHGKGSEEDVAETDRQIDRKERDIENLCMQLLLQQQPVARDLRMISSALKIISDMERIGDQAADIAEIIPFIKETPFSGRTHLADMAEATIRMVTESVNSFVRKDVALAQQVIGYDDTVDALFLEVKKELIDGVRSGRNDNDAEALIDMLMIAKYFERIGDHAENIAEWVIYSVTGEHASEGDSHTSD